LGLSSPCEVVPRVLILVRIRILYVHMYTKFPCGHDIFTIAGIPAQIRQLSNY
jgi:hypothetical protein